MILCITNKNHENLWDFLEDDHNYIIKKYIGNFYLQEFLSKNKNFDSYEYIYIDMTCINDENDELIKAVKVFQKSNYAKIILFFKDVSDHIDLIQNFIDSHFYNMFMATKIKDFKQKALFFLNNNNSKKQALSMINKDFKTICFNKQNFTIAFAGAISRLGTTSSAINLADILANHDLEVAYIEYNDSGHLQMILDEFKITKIDGIYVYRGISFFRAGDIVPEQFDVYIYDMRSVYNDFKLFINELNDFDKIFLIHGTKPYERDNLDFSSVYKDITHLYFPSQKNKNSNLKYLEICTDYFENDINEKLYINELLEHIKK